jgi:thymidylate synthase (FAD)
MIEVTYMGHMGDDLTVVNAARVSFNKESFLECIDLVKGKYALSHKDTKLITYLAKHKHMSPFGHCFASFHVKAPVFVARQLVKHKFLRWNEVSRRYVDEEPEFYEPSEWRGKAEDKKQGSSGVVDVKGSVNMGRASWAAKEAYTMLLKLGVAPEQARMVLPQSMMTQWWWSGSLDAFADMCALRCTQDTQQESREVAMQIDEHMEKLFPVSWKALRKNYG